MAFLLLTRPDDKPCIVQIEQVCWFEPDDDRPGMTIIMFSNGRFHAVKESVQELQDTIFVHQVGDEKGRG